MRGRHARRSPMTPDVRRGPSAGLRVDAQRFNERVRRVCNRLPSEHSSHLRHVELRVQDVPDLLPATTGTPTPASKVLLHRLTTTAQGRTRLTLYRLPMLLRVASLDELDQVLTIVISHALDERFG